MPQIQSKQSSPMHKDEAKDTAHTYNCDAAAVRLLSFSDGFQLQVYSDTDIYRVTATAVQLKYLLSCNRSLSARAPPLPLDLTHVHFATPWGGKRIGLQR